MQRSRCERRACTHVRVRAQGCAGLRGAHQGHVTPQCFASLLQWGAIRARRQTLCDELNLVPQLRAGVFTKQLRPPRRRIVQVTCIRCNENAEGSGCQPWHRISWRSWCDP
eukprot:4922511-Pleurochrysis_carterae.AAC.1